MADENINVSGAPLEFDSILKLDIDENSIKEKVDRVTQLLNEGINLPDNLKQQFLNAANSVNVIADNIANLKNALKNASGDRAIFLQKDIENSERFLQTAKDSLDSISDKILALPQAKPIDIQIKTLAGNGDAKGLSDLFDRLISKAEKLGNAMASTKDPKLIDQYYAGLKELEGQMNDVGAALQGLSDKGITIPDPFKETSEGADKAVTAMTRLRQIRNELASMSPDQRGTEQWEKLNEEGSQLYKTLRNVHREMALQGSNTAGITAAKEGLRGLVGGFEAVSGAITIFGKDSKEAEEATKKVIGAMGILNGIEEVAALLSKDSALNYYLQGVAQKFLAASAGEAAVAEGTLTAAMLANPVGVIVASVAALYGAYEIYAHTLGEATEAEKEHAAVLKAQKDVADAAADIYAKEEASLTALVTSLKDANATRQQQSDTLTEIQTKFPGYLSGLTVENANTERGNELVKKQIELIKNKATAQAAESVYADALKEQVKAQNEYNEAMAKFKETFSFSASSKLTDAQKKLKEATIAANAAFDSQSKALSQLSGDHQSDADKLQNYIDKMQGVIDKSNVFTKIINQALLDGAKEQLKTASTAKVFDEQEFEKEKKKILENATIKAELNKKSYEAQKGLIDATYDEEKKRLKGLFGSGSDYTQGLNVAAAKYKADLKELTQSFQSEWAADSVNAAQAVVQNLVTASKKGTEEYYNAEIALARAAAHQAIVDAQGDAGAIAKAQSQLNATLKSIQLERTTDAIQARRDEIAGTLAIVQKGSQQELELRIQDIQLAAQKELEQANLSAEKRRAIELKSVQQILDLKSRYYYEGEKNVESIELASLNTRLAATIKGSAEELRLRQSIITAQAALEITSIRQSESNEELKAAKIKEINAKAYADRLAQAKAFYEKLFNDRIKAIDDSAKSKNSDLQLTIDDNFSSNLDKLKAQRDQINNDIEATHKKIIAYELEITKTDITNTRKFNELRSKIATLQTVLSELGIKFNNIDFQIQQAPLDAVAEKISGLANDLNSLAQGARDLNDGLFEIIGTAAEAANSVKVVLSAVKALQEAKKKEDGGDGDLLGTISSITSIAAAVTAVISSVVNIIKKGKEERQKNIKAVEDYNNKALQGELDINKEYRDRTTLQAQLNKLKISGIEAEKKAAQENKESIQKDYEHVLNLIQQQDFIAGYSQNSKEKKHGWIGTVADMESLAGKSFDELQKLFLSGKLNDKAAQLFQQLNDLKQQGADVDKQLQDIQDQQDQLFTGTTSDNILDSIVQGLEDGKRAVADFAGDFQATMRKALIQTFEYKSLEKPIQDFYQKFAAATESDQTLTDAEIAQLEKQYNDIITNAGKQFDQLNKIVKENPSSTDNSLAGAIKGITENQANVLEGTMNGMRLTLIEQLSVARNSFSLLSKIESHTSRLESMETILKKFDTQGIKLK